MKDELKDEKEEKVSNKDFMTIHHKGICLSGSLVAYHHYLEHSRQEWNLITGIHDNIFPNKGREERENMTERERDKLSLRERNDENSELETRDAKSGLRSSR